MTGANTEKYSVIYTDAAVDDLERLDGSVRKKVLNGISRASYNPLPKSEGGYGKPLGNKSGVDLTNYLEIKFLGMGIRAVYRLIRTEHEMKIIVVSVRKDEIVFKEALKRIKRGD